MSFFEGNIYFKELDIDTNKICNIFSLQNLIVDNGMVNFCNYLHGDRSLCSFVSKCKIGIGGVGDDYLFINRNRQDLVNTISIGHGGVVILYNSEIVQNGMSVVFSFKFNVANILFTNGITYINEIGLVFYNDKLFTYKSFNYSPYFIKENKILIIDYEIKIRRYTLTSSSSTSSESSLSSFSSHSSISSFSLSSSSLSISSGSSLSSHSSESSLSLSSQSSQSSQSSISYSSISSYSSMSSHSSTSSHSSILL